MTYLKRITRENTFQIRYEMSDGTYSSFRADEEICDFIDLAIGNVELIENIHAGMVATEKYLKQVYKNHGALALRMLIDNIIEENDTQECPRCKKQVPYGEVQERHSAQVYAGKFCEDCAISGYRDHCGIDGTPQLSASELDEPLEPDWPTLGDLS